MKSMKCLFWFSLTVVLMVSAGCGGAGTDIDQDGPKYSHFLFGAVKFKLVNDNIVVTHSHQGDVHYNLTDPLSEPLCPECITIEKSWHDKEAHSIGLSISIQNPGKLTFYDVRGIIHGGPGLRLLESDGFTDLFSPEPITMNPFLSYCLEQADTDFPPNYTSTRVFSLTYETPSDVDATLIIEGSYPGHCEEPAILKLAGVDDANLEMLGGEGVVTVEAIDRQGDLAGLVAGCSVLWDGSRKLTHLEGDQYKIAFANENYASPGIYQVVFTAWSNDSEHLPISQTASVELKPSDEADAYLGGGHPIEGVNYRRNNRSPYDLHASQSSLNNVNSVSPFYVDEIDDIKYQGLVIDEDEKLYVGQHMLHEDTLGDSIVGSGTIEDAYAIQSFHFDEPFGKRCDGGKEMVLTTSGVFTNYSRFYWDYTWYLYKYPYGGHQVKEFESSLSEYTLWPDVNVGVSEAFTWVSDIVAGSEWGYVYFGDPQSRRFGEFFPLPDGRVLVAVTRSDDIPPKYLQLLDENLEVIKEIELAGEVKGYAFDSELGAIYVSTAGGLYAFNWAFQPKWDTVSSKPDFADDIPVLTDDGGILGCHNGVLCRIEPDGTIGAEANCSAATRPAILNDGTVVVICASTIALLDEGLNMLDEIPLPDAPPTNLFTIPPLVDAKDNLVLSAGKWLFIIDRNGNEIDSYIADTGIRNIRLGPQHLFAAFDYLIVRFGF